MSLGSKYNEINDFYTLLNAFINTHETTTTETEKSLKQNFEQCQSTLQWLFWSLQNKLQQYKCKKLRKKRAWL